MEELKLEVQVISTEMIKPSTPTPTTSKLFTVSCLDKASAFAHYPILLFYRNKVRDDSGSGSGPNTRPIDITTLKTSLSETLTSFYPLAGRSNSDSTILCDDQGIPFIETRVNCNLDDLLNSPRKLYLLGKILPSFQLYMSYGQRPIDEIVHVVIQLNVFLCGGVAITCYMLHKILDGTSASVFLNYWAALVRAKSGALNFSLNEPDFEATIKAFPPIPSSNINDSDAGDNDVGKAIASNWSYLKSITVVCKSFVFNNEAIKKLKDKVVTSDNNKLTNPTSFESVTGFIWHHIFAAACTAASVPNSGSGPSEVSFTANIRQRMTPPLPKTSIGNIFKGVHAQVDTLCDISKHATAIHEAISEVNKNVLENLPEKVSIANQAYYKFGSYTITNWCKLGLNEVDFGFGKPNGVIPVGMVHPVLRNFILMVDNPDVSGGIDGIEAYLCLEEKEMQNLESNSQFRVFASPN
ncbi:stemmadenine O-acetyltransferase-like [Silene latifolia]|uniref:stemmadenine O-acetyltransferase-like n=1 Tax=Silene latifolia TaxID=37657 RepID=UPI003D76CA52